VEENWSGQVGVLRMFSRVRTPPTLLFYSALIGTTKFLTFSPIRIHTLQDKA
jgi:hypothetical protein